VVTWLIAEGPPCGMFHDTLVFDLTRADWERVRAS
jgi:hypothetical protein